MCVSVCGVRLSGVEGRGTGEQKLYPQKEREST